MRRSSKKLAVGTYDAAQLVNNYQIACRFDEKSFSWLQGEALDANIGVSEVIRQCVNYARKNT